MLRYSVYIRITVNVCFMHIQAKFEYFGIVISKNLNIEKLEYWNIGILEYWDFGILRYWNVEILEYWDIGILRYWDIGILRY